MPKLAINGGTPQRTKLFPSYNTIGEDEKIAVKSVLDSGNLSQFLGAWSHDFLGGPKVREFETKWSEVFGVKHTVAVNSNTSGLYCAIAAIGIRPGDEVIVTPYSMSASAISPLMYGGVPVFADIDPNTFCLDPDSIKSKITSRTKAILIVHIFGHPADMDSIMQIAKDNNLYVIEDAAQCPLGKYKGRNLGTFGDIGVFSLNYHKHIHTGEGGMIVTNNFELAERCQLIRNHAENIVEHKGFESLPNMIGCNYRMTEMEAAIGVAQLDKLPRLLEERIDNVAFLSSHLINYEAFKLQPELEYESVHCYYQHPIKFNKEIAGFHRDTFVKALKAEVPSAILRENAPIVGAGYVRPLYLLPIFKNKRSWVYESGFCSDDIRYEPGMCPVVEKMYYEELFTHEFMRPGMSKDDMMDVINSINKIFENSKELIDLETKLK